MLLEVIVDFHAWSAARPAHESDKTADQLETGVRILMEIEQEQGKYPPPSHPSQLDKEIADDEARMELYGGDDVQEPPQLSHKEEQSQQQPSSGSSPVTWDGPNDPSNPQNWSKLRKWLLTILCAGVTVNV